MEGSHPYSRRPTRSASHNYAFPKAQDSNSRSPEGRLDPPFNPGQSQEQAYASPNSSPGRKKGVPASLDLLRSNMMPFGGSADASAAQSSMQESPDQSMTHSASLENSRTGPSSSAYVGPRHPYASSSSAEPDVERHYHHNASSGSQRIFDSIHKSPRAEEDPASSANASHSSPSPNVSLSPQDRTNLVGLGELATPKWDSTSSDRYHWLSHMTASSSGSPQEPHTLPSLVPFESPLAFSGSPQQSGMPNSSSSLSLAEASALGAKTAPSSSSSGSERPAPSSSNDSPVSKSGSAAMSAIDHLLGEFEGNEAASADNSAFDGHQSSSRHPSRHQHHALPQLPSKNTESSSNNNSQHMQGLGVGIELPSPAMPVQQRVPSGPRLPLRASSSQHHQQKDQSFSSSDLSQASQLDSTPVKTASASSSARRPKLDRQFSAASQGSDLSVASPSAPPATASIGKSPRTSQHAARRQSQGGASMRSRSSSLHPQSPAHLAHAIMRHASEEGVDVDSLADHDNDTAAALRKLDGLSSSSASRTRHRGDSSASGTAAPRRDSASSSLKRTPSTESKSRRPRSKENSGKAPPPFDPSAADVPALPSPMSAGSSPRVSVSGPSGGSGMNAARRSRMPSHDQRASTSSTSLFSGAGTGPNTPRDSTSYTSASTSAQRVPSKTGRRGSGTSEVSSSGLSDISGGRRLSSESGTANALYAAAGQDSAAIPPVPPLPKDLESYSQPGSAVTDTFQHRQTSSSMPQSASSRHAPASAEASPSISTNDTSSSAGSSPVISQSAGPRSPGKKWSISGALHLGRNTSQAPTASSSGSSAKLQSARTPQMRRKPSAESTASGTSFVGSFASRKSSSSNDISALAVQKPVKSRMSHSPSLATIPSSTSAAQVRSGSQAGHEGKSEGGGGMTSSSSIPFFRRRTSSSSRASADATHVASPAVAPSESNADVSPKESTKDRSGRKSILGLNFLSRKDRKPEMEASAGSASATQERQAGQRSSRVSARPSAVNTEKRIPRSRSFGTAVTSPSQQDDDHKTMTSSTSTLRGNQSPSMSHFTETSSAVPRSVSSKSTLTSRVGKVQDEVPQKGGLPTILGSPSDPKNATQGSSEKPPQGPSQTPTRIPRRVGTGSTSPRLSLMSEFGVVEAAEKALTNGTLQVEEYDSRATSSASASSRANMSGKSRTDPALASSQSSGKPAEDVTSSAAPPSRHVKRRSLLGAQADKSKPGSPITNRTPVRVPRRVSSPATSSGQSSVAAAHTRRPSKSINAATSRKESSLAEEAASTSAKPPRPRVPPTIPATVTAASKMSKSTTMPSMQDETRRRRESSTNASASASRRQTPVEDPEFKADQEMSQYVRRVTSKKLAAGVSSDEIRALFEFPEPTRPTRGMTAREASALFSRELSEYEKEEIHGYNSVYYVGQGSRKVLATPSNTRNNHGYDDDRGDYNVVAGDHILYRYQIMDVLGKGSFGQVLQCLDHGTGQHVAIKIIRNKNRFHKQAVVEVKVLDNLRNWDPDEKHNVIKMTDHFCFRSHLCIVTELLSINLYELIKANSFHGFSTTLIRRFAVQMLNAMTLLRHHRVVHCDLKPENVLLMHPCKSAVKVIDFGSSCFENEKVYTYIQSRFYRSIEVILGSNYHMAIDMWSLGCILAEMYTGVPLFPGENEQEQLACIMEILGVPEKHLVEKSSRRKLFFDSTGAPRPVVSSKGRRRRPGSKSLAQVMKCDDEQFVDFIQKCLVYDPERRMKPQAALRHPFVRAEMPRATTPGNNCTASRPIRHSTTGSVSISAPKRKLTTTAVSSTPQTTTTPSYLSHSASRATSARTRPTPANPPASIGPGYRHIIK